MRSARRHGEAGFIREILWLTVVLAVLAVVVLDALALFNANQSVKNAAAKAANEARNEYAQSLDVASARLAAQSYLARSGKKLVSFSTSRGLDGDVVFTVKAQAHANTRVYRLLRHVGLRDWVDDTVDPRASRSSD